MSEKGSEIRPLFSFDYHPEVCYRWFVDSYTTILLATEPRPGDLAKLGDGRKKYDASIVHSVYKPFHPHEYVTVYSSDLMLVVARNSHDVVLLHGKLLRFLPGVLERVDV